MNLSNIDFGLADFIIHPMGTDRSLCAICAWRRDCKKKFMHAEGVYCPDYTKDLTIRDKEPQEEKRSTDKKTPHRTRFL